MISGGDFLAHIQRSGKIKTTFLLLGKEMAYDEDFILNRINVLHIVCITNTVLLMMGCGDKSMRQVLSDFQRFFFSLSLRCFSVALDSQGI